LEKKKSASQKTRGGYVMPLVILLKIYLNLVINIIIDTTNQLKSYLTFRVMFKIKKGKS
jgi:hypothetical protein